MNLATSFTVICLVPLSAINFFNALKKKIARPVHYRIIIRAPKLKLMG